jgi:Xaa-Pro aminopeptidase
MRSDIDELMKEQNIDALWVIGDMKNNADMVYFTGPQEVRNADLFKIVGKPPVVYHITSLEREEASKSSFETYAMDTSFPLEPYLQKHSADLLSASAERYHDVFNKIGLITGNVAVSGKALVQDYLPLIELLSQLLPNIKFTGYFNAGVIQESRMTKEPSEVDRIRKMGQITKNVVGNVADFLTQQSVDNGHLVEKNGKPITIALIKSKINLWLAEAGCENPEETIFSLGRDAGIPHNSGNPKGLIELGKPIVFDIYPCEKGGGYFYDFTRTWCLGSAPEEVQSLHNQVASVFNQVVNLLEVDKPFKVYQEIACRLFSGMGHTTIAEKPETTEGYVHSIGHGLGLDLHENPFSGITATEKDFLRKGVVFTIEPGLYYPSKGMGVRIEDSMYLNPNGKFEILADYPYELVLPMKRY